MSKLIILTVLFVYNIDITSAQCPGIKALEQKRKLEQFGDQSYAIAATYYAYKCECEHGSERSSQLIQIINDLVDTYHQLKSNVSKGGISVGNTHIVEWENVSKVNTCKSSNGTTEGAASNTDFSTAETTSTANENNLYSTLMQQGANEEVLKLIETENYEEALKLHMQNYTDVLKTYVSEQNTSLDNPYNNSYNEAVNQMNAALSQFGIDNNVVYHLENEDFEAAEKQMQANQLQNNLTQLTGNASVSAGIANSLYALGNALQEERNLENIENFKSLENHINSLTRTTQFKNTNGKYKADKEFVYTGNFNDGNWEIIDRPNYKVEIINNNEFHIEEVKKIGRNAYKYDDVAFLKYESEAFSAGKDFVIEFDVVWDNFSYSFFSFFISEPNQLTIGDHVSFSYSFTPLINSVKDYGINTEFKNLIIEKNPNLFYNIFRIKDLYNPNYLDKGIEIEQLKMRGKQEYEALKLLNISLNNHLKYTTRNLNILNNENQGLSYFDLDKKEKKEYLKKAKEYVKSKDSIENKETSTKISKHYKIIKEGEKIKVIESFGGDLESIPFDFKFIKSNILYFALTFNNHYTKKRSFTVKNFTISQ